MEDRNHYVYAHYKPNEKLPFYIGVGKNSRAWDVSNRNPIWKRVVKKYGFDVKILCENISKLSALIIEEQLIREYGRIDNNTGCLVNLTDGGDGCHGHSEETRRLISDDNLRRWADPEYREKMQKIRSRQKPKNPELASRRKSLSLTGGKVYVLEGPDKKRYECINQAKFAREHGLAHSHLSAFVKGKYRGGKQVYKGWRVVYEKTIDIEEQ